MICLGDKSDKKLQFISVIIYEWIKGKHIEIPLPSSPSNWPTNACVCVCVCVSVFGWNAYAEHYYT